MGMNQVGIDAIVKEFARQFNNPGYTFAGENYINGPWGCTCVILASPPIGVVASIAITPAVVSVAVGNTVQLTCTATTTLNSLFDCTKMVTWGVAPPRLGGIAAGLLTGNMTGTGNINATYMQSGSPITAQPASLTVTATLREAEEVAAAVVANGAEAPTQQDVPPPIWLGLCGYYCLIGPIQCNTPIAAQITPYVTAMLQIISDSPKSAGLNQPNLDLKLAQEELQ